MTDLDIDHLTPGPWHKLTVRDEPAKAHIHLTHPDSCHGPRCRIGREAAMFAEGLPLGEYQVRVSGLGAEYRHADGTAVEGRPTRLDPVPVGTRVLHWGQIWARSLPGGTGEVIQVEGPDRHGDYEYLVRTGHDLSMPPSVDNPETDERWWSSRHTRPALKETP